MQKHEGYNKLPELALSLGRPWQNVEASVRRISYS
jgi:hypothetical protein